jgi:hypothetical protein
MVRVFFLKKKGRRIKKRRNPVKERRRAREFIMQDQIMGLASAFTSSSSFVFSFFARNEC